jgi:hypothetical protein
MDNLQWKDVVARLLLNLGVIDESFTGRLTINLNQGGVTEIEVTEKVEKSDVN